MRTMCIRAIALVAVFLIAQPLRLIAEEKRVVDEILEILRSSGQIDKAKYHDLRQRLAAEEQEREEGRSQPVDGVAPTTISGRTTDSADLGALWVCGSRSIREYSTGTT